MKRIIIVGGTSGIGRAIVEAFASRGVPVGVAGRSVSALDELRAKYPGCIEAEVINVNKPEAKAQLFRLVKKMGGMDIYIHAAGIGMPNPMLNPEEEVKVAATNACGFARMIASVYNFFRATGRPGQIVGITSIASTRGIGDLAAYSASKAFAATYLEALRQLSHKHGLDVSITDIQPGWIRTPLLRPEKHYPLEMKLDYAVLLILKAIVKKKDVAVIDGRWAVVKRAWRLLPASLWQRMSGFGI